MENETQAVQKEKLWTFNFFLLWQGQFVSAIGDIVYEIALGFWVLAVTGSTALMGTLMAASTIPRVLISPFAGVIVDRSDRKYLLVLMDFIRGIFVVFIGIAAYKGFISVWMVFTAGIVLGIGGAFFNPSVSSTIPDIVPQSKLIGANSVFGIIQTGSSIIGSSAGGFILQALGAPFMFLFNGISYIFSAITEMFLKIPKLHKTREEQHFLADMKDGYTFVWKFRGLRYILIMASILNFITFIAIVLFLPLYQRTESLGPGKYGVSMAFFTSGMLFAMILTSIVKIPPASKLKIFMLASSISSICFATFPLVGIFPVMLAMLFCGGFFLAIINVFINSTIQLTVPQHMRGKVFSLVGMISSSLTPFAMALGGILGEFIPIKIIIFTCFMLILIIFIPFTLNHSFKRFINFDADKERPEDIM